MDPPEKRWQNEHADKDFNILILLLYHRRPRSRQAKSLHPLEHHQPHLSHRQHRPHHRRQPGQQALGIWSSQHHMPGLPAGPPGLRGQRDLGHLQRVQRRVWNVSHHPASSSSHCSVQPASRAHVLHHYISFIHTHPGRHGVHARQRLLLHYHIDLRRPLQAGWRSVSVKSYESCFQGGRQCASSYNDNA